METFKRSILFMTVLAIALLPTLTLASAQIVQSSSLRMNSAKPEGKYVVYVLQGEKWQEVGALSYGRFFQEKRIDLGKGATEEEMIKVRLVQKEGGAAHIDSVFLGGLPPSEVKGMKDEKVLKKLSRKDCDVIDASGQDLELYFSPAKDRVLSLTARVEGERVSETPFQFPPANLYKPMNEKSAFYTYKTVGSRQEEDRPFFKEYSLTGTGHPSGYTYGWVWNDDHHLYVKIDFTPDNTMDGNKDYAKVYVKVGGEVKEFKVSESEMRWGHPDFSYTDKVSYEHKVYGFEIPLKELGINGEGNGQELLLAFSTYGTAGPPAIDFSPSENSYLILFEKYIVSTSHVYGQMVDVYGVPFGSDFPIADPAASSYGPSLAYDSANQMFLVAWQDQRNSVATGSDIYGQFVNANGTLNGSNFIICNANESQYSPQAAYDSVNQRFLVVWTDNRNSATLFSDIYGQFVNANGTLNGSNFIICNANSYQDSPHVVYDSVNQRFLVVWADNRNSAATGSDIYGQMVNANGTLNGNNFIICNANENQSGLSVAYDSANQRFLVVWQDYRNSASTGADIYGQFFNANGTLSGSNFIICNANDGQYSPSVAYDSSNQRFLVVWSDSRNQVTTEADIYGQFVNADGILNGGNFVINEDPGSPYGVVLAYNPICSNFMVAYWTGPALAYVVVGSPCGIREGTIGTRFIISGSGFGNSKPTVYLMNGGQKVQAKVEVWSDSSITCLWTKKLPTGTYPLFIQPKGKGVPPVAAGNFTIMPPSIDEITPDDGAAGDVITVSGWYFTNKKPKVYFEDPDTHKRKSCKVLSSSMDPETGSSTLQFVIPKWGLAHYNLILINAIAQTTAEFPVDASLYVDALNGNDLSPGTSNAPFKTITHALSVAGPNKTIRVRPATYNAALGEVFPLLLQPGQVLIGDEVNKGDGATPTIIVGHGSVITEVFNFATIVGAEGSRIAGFKVGVDPFTVLHAAVVADGITMEITNNTFMTPTYGGILLANNGTSVVDNNLFDTISYGVYVWDCPDGATIRNNTFLAMGLPIDIAGINTHVVISNNTITGNGLVGIQVQSGYPLIENNTFNSAAGYGVGAIKAGSGSATPKIRGNVFACATAIIVDDGNPDLGTIAEHGNNNFSAVTGVSITHNGAATVYAIGNTWPSALPLCGTDIIIPAGGAVIWGSGLGQQCP